MGRANVYLPDDLERRVKATGIPISEVCQRALLVAVEAAETGGSRLDDAVRQQLRRGHAAGEAWARTATPEQLLTLLREQRLEEIPPDALPDDLYSLTAEQNLAWEAGFSVAARESARRIVAHDDPSEPTGTAGEAPVRLDKASEEPTDAGTETGETRIRTDDEAGSGAGSAPRLGDDAGARIGATVDGTAVSFDPHAAVRASKSPLFAVLGQNDLRARLTMSLAQDAAARGTAVVLLDVSGQLSAGARGLGKNVRVVRAARPTMPSHEDWTRGAVSLGGLFDMLSGSGLLDLFRTSSNVLPPPGHVTVLDMSGDDGLSNALALAQAAHLLSQLNAPADHPRLVQIDLPSTVTVPPPLAARLAQLFRGARNRNAALGVSADSAQVLTDLSGTGSLLSTVFAFATSNPVEADRLRDLLGSGAPILLNPPGALPTADEQTWVVMRDLHGRLGQVRLDPS
jgi:hypothetical protein